MYNAGGDNIYQLADDGAGGFVLNGLITGSGAPVAGNLLLSGGLNSSNWQVAYTRDKLGRITEKTETAFGETHISGYDYDPAGRLEVITRDGAEVARYTYDSNDNRTHINGVEVAQYDGQDRLLSYNGVSYSYNANGDLQSKTESGVVTSYQYDVFGNLAQVTLPGDVVIDYVVDAQNRRIGKKVNGLLTQGFLYADQLNPVAELNGSGQVVSRFVYAEKANVPSYMIRGGITYRIISDHLGSPRFIVNTQDESIAQRMDYDEWGNITLDTNPGFQPFGFAGGLYDQYTQLTRFGARDYDAQIGRWTVKDPIGFSGGQSNIYVYVTNDPVNRTDPLGLDTCLLTVRNIFGVGNHSALYTSSGQSELYDPSGGYGLENGGEVLDGRHLNDFIEYHNKEFDSVEMQCKKTTANQEKKIRNEIMMRPTASGPTCSLNVSDVLSRSGVFDGINGPTLLPGNLSRDFSNASVKNE